MRFLKEAQPDPKNHEHKSIYIEGAEGQTSRLTAVRLLKPAQFKELKKHRVNELRIIFVILIYLIDLREDGLQLDRDKFEEVLVCVRTKLQSYVDLEKLTGAVSEFDKSVLKTLTQYLAEVIDKIRFSYKLLSENKLIDREIRSIVQLLNHEQFENVHRMSRLSYDHLCAVCQFGKSRYAIKTDFPPFYPEEVSK